MDIDGDARVVSEATAYDVTLPADPDQQPTGQQPTGAGRVKGISMLIALLLLLTGAGLYLATLSNSSVSSSH